MKALAYTVIDHFAVSGDVQHISSFGSGHIHDTFLVETASKKYLLQKINTHVFKNVSELMSNIVRVTEHLNRKLNRQPEQKPLKLITTRKNKLYYTGIKNDHWRLYEFIDNSASFDLPPDTDKAFEGGRAFGNFISYLSDLPGGRLYQTIANFHNMHYRLGQFNTALVGNDKDRLAESSNEIKFVHKHAASLVRFYDLYRKGLIPERITHNDTKFNNILFNQEGRALCVVDLDTVMPGSLHFDFGDAVRIIGNSAAEDEPDLTRIGVNMEMYQAFTRGFLMPLKSLLTGKEKETLALAPLYMTFIMGLRFLTDYLTGDKYYKIAYPQHNWYRACAQFQLFRCMVYKEKEMRKIISESLK